MIRPCNVGCWVARSRFAAYLGRCPHHLKGTPMHVCALHAFARASGLGRVTHTSSTGRPGRRRLRIRRGRRRLSEAAGASCCLTRCQELRVLADCRLSDHGQYCQCMHYSTTKAGIEHELIATEISVALQDRNHQTVRCSENVMKADPVLRGSRVRFRMPAWVSNTLPRGPLAYHRRPCGLRAAVCGGFPGGVSPCSQWWPGSCELRRRPVRIW